MAQGDWFQTWFGSPYYRKLYAQRDDAEAQGFADAVLAHLNPPAGCTVLDIACGEGRLSKELAQHGYDVTGIDLSATSIGIAKAYEAENLHFFVHDMRLPFRINYFDLALNFFTSFGYFATRRDHQTAANSFTAALRPGGTLVLDYLNSTKILRDLIPDQTLERGGTSFHITKRLEAGVIVKDIRFEDCDGRQRHYTERVAAFSQEELAALFANAGLQLTGTFGDYRLAPFDAQQSPRLILLFKK